MLILLMLALAASDGSTKTAPPGQFRGVTLSAPQREWFQQRAKPFGSSVRMAQEAPSDEPSRTAEQGAGTAEMTCTIRVLKADPGFDAAIVRPAPPGLDPKIVRPSPCRK
ncbi:MAG TPA: hypothetical protein PLD86_18025 [Vicinamibacteria bacterium]|nr:hypothetical protein [Vicinamibacteria bacterium]